jgi:hypothetical protein
VRDGRGTDAARAHGFRRCRQDELSAHTNVTPVPSYGLARHSQRGRRRFG